MYPVILQIGPLTIYSYGLMMALAVVVCSWALSRESRRAGIPPEKIFDLVFWVMLMGIAGARIFYILLNLEFFRQNLSEIFMIQRGGLAFQGGFILGGLTGYLYIRRQGWPLWVTLDLVAPYLALGHAIGRVGCFFNGCCYGRPVSWGIYFPAHEARLHPTQLYDTAALLFIFLILKYWQKQIKTPGYLFVFYLLLASGERFINEFFRADHAQTYLGMSIYQVVSLGIFIFGLILFSWIKQHQSVAKEKHAGT